MGLFKSKQKRKVKEDLKRPKDTIGEFLRIQDVVGYSKYNINPSFIEAKIEKAISSQLKGARSIPFMWIMAIAVIFIAGGIAYVLISGQGNNTQCLTDLKNCYATCSPAIKNAVQSTTSAATIR